MLNDSCFEEIKASGRLPSPNGIALEIMRMTQSATTSIQDLAGVVRLDPALTGRLVQLANSAHHALRRPVAAAQDAIRLLGTRTVRQFALTLSIIGANRSGACQHFDYDEFWTSSLARALATRALAVHDCMVTPEEAFTCAILSNVGQLALASVYPFEYGECLLQCSGNGDIETLIQAEHAAFAIDHRRVTVELLKDWGFPSVLVDSVSRHHEALEVGASFDGRVERFAAQLRLAGALSSQMTSAVRCDGAMDDLLSMAHPLALDVPDLEQIYGVVEKQWGGYCRLFEIKSINLTPPKVLIAPESAEAETVSAGPKVLLIHRDPKEASRLRNVLGEKYPLCAATGMSDGVRVFLQQCPRLIIVEHHEAGMDAVRFCENVRSMDIGREVYLMILAEGEAEEALVRAYTAGVNDFVVSPVNDRVLLARIESGMRMIQLQDENEQEKEMVRRQVSKLAIANRKLETLAMTDPLTGVPNRRYAFTRLREEWSTWRRTARPLSVMILDLDHFKEINDNFGHQAGDRMLAHVAGIIRENLRGADAVCRLGGEEFIILAPGTDEKVAHALAERLRNAIEKSPMDADDLTKLVTASIGVATSSARVANPNDLLHLADEALYAAKVAGRNRIKLYTPPQSRLQ